MRTKNPERKYLRGGCTYFTRKLNKVNPLLKFFFYHPDFTVGSGISPDQSCSLKIQALGVADFTAGREFWSDCSNPSPCPEELFILCF
jgi:hypothetical protein